MTTRIDIPPKIRIAVLLPKNFLIACPKEVFYYTRIGVKLKEHGRQAGVRQKISSAWGNLLMKGFTGMLYSAWQHPRRTHGGKIPF
jgi:hypothetical protein